MVNDGLVMVSDGEGQLIVLHLWSSCLSIYQLLIGIYRLLLLCPSCSTSPMHHWWLLGLSSTNCWLSPSKLSTSCYGTCTSHSSSTSGSASSDVDPDICCSSDSSEWPTKNSPLKDHCCWWALPFGKSSWWRFDQSCYSFGCWWSWNTHGHWSHDTREAIRVLNQDGDDPDEPKWSGCWFSIISHAIVRVLRQTTCSANANMSQCQSNSTNQNVIITDQTPCAHDIKPQLP